MVLQLDPRFPLVWRSPHSLQLGVDRPAAVLHDVTDAQERMVSALVSGISRPGLAMVARSAGADVGEVDELLRAVAGAMRPPAASTPPHSVVLVGHGATVDRLAECLAGAGVVPRVVGLDDEEAASGEAGVGVIVAHYVVDPAYFGLWLRRDRPHLAVLFGDASVRIGPMVEPGIGPCLWCVERARSDIDAAWPAIASQLWGRRSRHDAGLVATEAAALASRMILARLVVQAPGAASAAEAGTADSLRVDAATGVTTRETWRRHRECGCGALPENATVDEPRIAVAGPRPTRGAAAGGPA